MPRIDRFGGGDDERELAGGLRPEPEGDGVLFSRVVSGGMIDKVRASIEVRADGTYQSSMGDETATGQLDEGQLALFTAICDVCGFGDLPAFIDGPISRSSSFLWTYRVGGHTVKMNDVERAGDAVPGALEVLETLAVALQKGNL